MRNRRSRFALAAALLAAAPLARADVTVTTAADLATALSTSPNTVLLGADLDLTGWTTVNGFSGTLNGQGYKIENLDAPLFGTITGDIAISNLVVKDASVTVAATPAGILMNSVTSPGIAVENVTFTGSTLENKKTTGDVGFVVGKFTGATSATFRNCHVDDTCSFTVGKQTHGGLIGSGATAFAVNAAISVVHCTMAATVTYSVDQGQFGGIAGSLFAYGGGGSSSQYAHLVMEDCTNNTPAITTTKKNCGFAGIAYSTGCGTSGQMGDAIIRRCTNHGSFSSSGANTSGTLSGILGSWSRGKLTVEDCVNHGSFATTGSDTGFGGAGIVNSVTTPIKVTVLLKGCANTGDISAYNAGGLVGSVSHNGSYSSTKTFLYSCQVSGTITARRDGAPAGAAIDRLSTSATSYPRIDVKGGLYPTNVLVGFYAEGASISTFNTADNVFLSASEGLVDGTDLATLNAYNGNCNLWKQGHEHPILKILPDEAAPDTITATFKDWDGTQLKQVTIARGGYCIPPAQNPERADYTFMGWEPSVFSGLTSNTTFVAQYVGGVLEYTVAFVDWNGMPLCTNQTVGHEGAATAPADPVREGYIFTGWDTAFNCVTEDLTVRALYVVEHVSVATAAELAEAATAETHPGVKVHLAADIELPADWASPDYSATLDGAGHTIACPNGGLPLFSHLHGCASNFVVDAASEGAPTTNSLASSAIFGAVANTLAGGAIRDVTVENLVIKTGEHCIVGLIAGNMADGAAIERCLAAASCKIRQNRTSGAGGIVGAIDRTTAFAPSDGEGNPVTGETLALVADCTNRAPLVAYVKYPVVCGGIVGNANVHNPTYLPAMRILRCVNEADFTSEVNTGSHGGSIGGIVGQRSYNSSGHGGILYIIDCANYGDIYAPGTSGGSFGGIMGYSWRACEAIIVRCVNRGAVGSATVCDGTTTVTGNNAGGIFGFASSLYVGNPITATNCANYGAVTAGSRAGGLVGGFDAQADHSNSKIMFYNCANYGTLTAVAENGKTGQIFAEFMTRVADSTSRQYGAVNSFFMTDQFYTENSGSTIITNGLVTAADAGYNPSAAKRALNAAVAESDGIYEEWRVGKAGPELLPFWDGFVPYTIILLK